METDLDIVIKRLQNAGSSLEGALFSDGPLMGSEPGAMLLVLALEIQRLKNEIKPDSA